MDFQDIARVLGAATGGYAQDQETELKRKALARSQGVQDEDRLNRALQAGYRPTGPMAAQATKLDALAPTFEAMSTAPSAPGSEMLPGMQGRGGMMQALAAAAKERANAMNPANVPQMTVTTANGPQSLAFDYESSPTGLAERKQRAKELQDQARQTAVDAQKAQEAALLKKQEADQKAAEATAHAKADYNTLKSIAPTHPLVRQPFDATNMANYSKAIDAFHADRTASIASAGTWANSGDVDKATGEPIYVNSRTMERKTLTGAQPKAGAGGAGGQTRLPERSQQLGLALHNAVEALPYHDQVVMSGSPGFVTGWLGEKSQQGNQPARGALNLTDEGKAYERYIDAINGTLLATAHSVGGARISKEQVNMFGGNMMVSTNDPPETVNQKTRAIVDFMNSARATLPPDMVEKQEASLPPAALKFLRDRGYGSPPTAAGNSVLMQVRSLGGDDAAITPQGAGNGPTADPKQAQRKTRWDQLVSGGMDKATATAQVRREIP